MLIGWTCVMDGHSTKNVHKPFFGHSVIHDLLTTHAQPIQQAQVP